MERLNIYVIHSTKFDYKNLLYKKLLSSSYCLSNNLILPMTKEYQEKYTKDLMNKADGIIVELSHPSFGLWIELEYLKKINKPKLFLSLDNKIPNNYKKLVNEFTKTTTEDYLSTIEEFIKKVGEERQMSNPNQTYTLGEL